MPVAVGPAVAPIADLLSGSYNGLQFDSFGQASDIAVAEHTGLDDLPVLLTSDVHRSQDDGSYLGFDYAGERVVTLKLMILGDEVTYRTLVDALRDAFSPRRSTELPLYFLGSTRLVFCRPTKRRPAFDHLNAAGFGVVDVELTATDPRIYDADLTTVSVPVATSSGGFTFPITFPLAFGSAGAGGTFQLDNIGNWSSPLSIHIAGPVDNPRIEHVDQGKTLRFAGSLSATDYLDIDTANHSIVLNNQASRRGWLTSDSAWFDIRPGINNLRYAANSVAVGSVATVSFRSAWL